MHPGAILLVIVVLALRELHYPTSNAVWITTAIRLQVSRLWEWFRSQS